MEVFHGNGHGLCMCYMLWLVRRGISGGGGGEPALGTGFAERAEWRQPSSGGGGPNPEATSAWGAGEGLRLRGEALMAALGSLRSVCATARSPRGQKCSFSDSSVQTRVLHSLETAPSAFLQRQFPSSSLVLEMFLCACSPGFLFTYLFLLSASLMKKAWPLVHMTTPARVQLSVA